MTAWPDGFPARSGRVRRRHGADGGVWPHLRTAQVRTGQLVAGQGDPAGATRMRRSGGDAGRDVHPRQAGSAADGRSAQRRRCQSSRDRPPCRRHLHRQLDRPVDVVERHGQDLEREHGIAGGGQRRRRGRQGSAAVVADRAGAVGAGAGANAHRRRGLRHRTGPWSPDAWPGHHRRFRPGGRCHQRSRRHRDRRPVVQRGPGRGHRVRRRICARST